MEEKIKPVEKFSKAHFQPECTACPDIFFTVKNADLVYMQPIRQQGLTITAFQNKN